LGIPKYHLSPQRAETLRPAGEDLVGITLMPDIPHDCIDRRIEHAVERDGQLHHAEIRCEVPPVALHGLNDVLTDFLC